MQHQNTTTTTTTKEETYHVEQRRNDPPKATTAAADVLTDVRETPEYAAAWDLELWKTVQIHKFQKELKEKERKAVEEMKQRIATKEKEELAHVERKLREVIQREKKLLESQSVLEKRKHKIHDAEITLRRSVDDTEEVRKRIEADAEERIRRIKEEAAHKLELMHQKYQQAQESTKKAEERVTNSQRDYMKLWDEFSDFKVRALAQNGPDITAKLDSMRIHHDNAICLMTERHDRRVAEIQSNHEKQVAELRAETQRLGQQLAQKKEQLKTAHDQLGLVAPQRDDAQREVTHLKRLVHELQLQRKHYQQHHHEQDQENRQDGAGGRKALASSVAAMTYSKKGGNSFAATHKQSLSYKSSTKTENQQLLNPQLEVVASQLRAERESLLRDYGGVYTEDSDLIKDLDRRIVEAERMMNA